MLLVVVYLTCCVEERFVERRSEQLVIGDAYERAALALLNADYVLVCAGAHQLLARWLPALPYTVGLLIFGIFIGALASWLRNRPQCPQMALECAAAQKRLGRLRSSATCCVSSST